MTKEKVRLKAEWGMAELVLDVGLEVGSQAVGLGLGAGINTGPTPNTQ